MHILPFIFLGIAAASPLESLVVPQPRAVAPPLVKIISISAIGTGCPAGHAAVTLDATGTIFDVAFDQYVVSAGPGSNAADSRKNCRVSINLQFSSGFQYVISSSRKTFS
jgi:hypothetical protein